MPKDNTISIVCKVTQPLTHLNQVNTIIFCHKTTGQQLQRVCKTTIKTTERRKEITGSGKTYNNMVCSVKELFKESRLQYIKTAKQIIISSLIQIWIFYEAIS